MDLGSRVKSPVVLRVCDETTEVSLPRHISLCRPRVARRKASAPGTSISGVGPWLAPDSRTSTVRLGSSVRLISVRECTLNTAFNIDLPSGQCKTCSSTANDDIVYGSRRDVFVCYNGHCQGCAVGVLRGVLGGTKLRGLPSPISMFKRQFVRQGN